MGGGAELSPASSENKSLPSLPTRSYLGQLCAIPPRGNSQLD